MKKVLNKTIKSARIRSGLTQKQLAEKINTSPSAIGMYEQGRREPNYDTLSKLCNALNLPVCDFLSEDDGFNMDKVLKYILKSLESEKNVFLNGELLNEQEKKNVAYVIKLILNEK
ncbi:MAG: helix-turn-helix transcriptional regulator [Clostridia bacterium]|nr:helix-turn-helix transcriptional regulator [Clostridia bacterium]